MACVLLHTRVLVIPLLLSKQSQNHHPKAANMVSQSIAWQSLRTCLFDKFPSVLPTYMYYLKKKNLMAASLKVVRHRQKGITQRNNSAKNLHLNNLPTRLGD